MNPLELSFTPVDNERLANLSGVLDENLKQIESAFDVSIARRGEHFSISGQPEPSRLAAEALQRFYQQAGQSIGLEEIQLGLIEITGAASRVAGDDSLVLQTRRRDLHGRTPRQIQYIRQIREHDITFGIGPAGTGKTYLAVACAVDAFERDTVKRIVLVRPAVEAGERLGFLPGDMAQKVDPYLRPLYDALYDLMGFDRVTKAFEKGQLEIAPLAFMRGRTLNHAFVILDEAQNTTPEQMKMFLTRIGFGSKCVVTGDTSQIDLPRGMRSGLVDAEEVLDGVEGIAITRLTRADVVRHPLVARIVQAYENQTEALALEEARAQEEHRAQFAEEREERRLRALRLREEAMRFEAPPPPAPTPAPAKRDVAKKPVTKKITVRAPAAKTVTAGKAPAAKATTKKPTAKKAAANKPATKKASARPGVRTAAKSTRKGASR